MVITNPHEIREKIRTLTANIEQAHSEGRPQIDSAVQRAARDIYIKQIRKIQWRKS